MLECVDDMYEEEGLKVKEKVKNCKILLDKTKPYIKKKWFDILDEIYARPIKYTKKTRSYYLIDKNELDRHIADEINFRYLNYKFKHMED